MLTLNQKCVTDKSGCFKAGAWVMLGSLLLLLQACAFKPFSLPEPLRRAPASTGLESADAQNEPPSAASRLPMVYGSCVLTMVRVIACITPKPEKSCC